VLAVTGSWNATALTEPPRSPAGSRTVRRPEQVRANATPTCDRSWNPPPKSPTEQESVFGTEVESLLRRLAQLSDTPIIALSHVVAVAMVDGAAAGLQRLETLANDKQLAEDHRLYAVRAHLLEMTGEAGAARDAYRAAARRASNLPQQRYLNRCAARLDEANCS
jgi:hypothetical protein